MVATTKERPVHDTEETHPWPERSAEVRRLVGAAIRITVDPTLSDDDRMREMVAITRDRGLLGRVWLRVAIESLVRPGCAVISAQELLRAALDAKTTLRAA